MYLAKAAESLAGAESEFANERFNNCANRCYFAAFQAAIAALLRSGIGPTMADGHWSHSAVQAQFAELIHRRKLYPSALQDVLGRAMILRAVADYSSERVTQKQADRTLRRTRDFIAAVRARGA